MRLIVYVPFEHEPKPSRDVEADPEQDSVTAASTGNNMSFAFTASGQMHGQQIRLEAPTGWSVPQRNPGGKG